MAARGRLVQEACKTHVMGFWKEVAQDIRAQNMHPLVAVVASKGVHALLAYRIAHRLYRIHIPVLPFLLSRTIQVFYGIDIDCRARLEGGITILHGVGLVIGAGASVGAGTRLYHGVTLGLAHREPDGFPQVGQRCLLGAGAKLLGPIRVGHDCIIGANAVLTRDVPDGSLAVGIPARIKPRPEGLYLNRKQAALPPEKTA